MTGYEIATTTMGAFGAIVSLVVGYFVLLGGDRASKRTAETTKESNSTDRFDRLTAAQDRALESAYKRAEEADERAENAEASAVAAKRSAAEAQRIAEACQLQQSALTQAYRELHAWASQPCPHDHPPPQPPLRLALL